MGKSTEKLGAFLSLGETYRLIILSAKEISLESPFKKAFHTNILSLLLSLLSITLELLHGMEGENIFLHKSLICLYLFHLRSYGHSIRQC
jgi:hypothetical protein